MDAFKGILMVWSIELGSRNSVNIPYLETELRSNFKLDFTVEA